jgi:hypothetical protein
MADSSEIDAALVATLANDPELQVLLPDGVFFDEAPPNATRFVLCTLVDSTDDRVFNARAIEHVTYRVTARVLSSVPGGNIKAAAARIDALLEGGTLTIPGYTLIAMYRDITLPRVRLIEVDDVDPTVRWFHRGGHYHVSVSL